MVSLIHVKSKIDFFVKLIETENGIVVARAGGQDKWGETGKRAHVFSHNTLAGVP